MFWVWGCVCGSVWGVFLSLFVLFCFVFLFLFCFVFYCALFRILGIISKDSLKN